MSYWCRQSPRPSSHQDAPQLGVQGMGKRPTANSQPSFAGVLASDTAFGFRITGKEPQPCIQPSQNTIFLPQRTVGGSCQPAITMSDSTADNGPLGCLNIGFGLAILGALIVFLQWLWGIMVAAAIWLWLVPGRLLAWILSWPMLSGHLLLGLLAGAATGVLTWLVFELVLKLIWPHQFLRASTRASGMLKGRYFWWGEEVMQFDFVEFCDHTTNSASIIMNRCLPRKHGQPDCGISIEQVSVEGISVHPGKARLSRRLRILRQPNRTYIESLQRHGIEPLAPDSMEAKAWQALLDSEHELTMHAELRESARSMLHDAQRVGFRDLAREAHATRAQDAALVVQHDALGQVEELGLADLGIVGDRGCAVVPVVIVLQQALAGLVADAAVNRVVERGELQNGLAVGEDVRRLGQDAHAGLDRHVAGDVQPAALFLHRADTAVAGHGQRRVPAEIGYVEAIAQRRLEDGLVGLGLHGLPVYEDFGHSRFPE